MIDMISVLKVMIEHDASDAFFTVASPPRIKVAGKLLTVGKVALTAEMAKAIVYKMMTDEQRIYFEKELEIDFAISIPELHARFRVNAFRQQGVISAVLRLIKSIVPKLEELYLPDVLSELISRKRGLLLMVGATNSGKSTTLAAMLNYRNEHQSGHIVTIEDPIEFVHPHKKSLVNQRELGVDTRSYEKALRSAMRESPDVILVGEIRDRETMSAALELSNTGHLAISTLHANNANQAMQRVINMYAQEQHKQLYMDLSLNLVAVISQRLVPSVAGKRVAAIEIMINNPHVADLILNGRIDEIKDAMKDSGSKGMQTFDMALYELYKNGFITLDAALDNSDSRTNLEAKINFG